APGGAVLRERVGPADPRRHGAQAALGPEGPGAPREPAGRARRARAAGSRRRYSRHVERRSGARWCTRAGRTRGTAGPAVQVKMVEGRVTGPSTVEGAASFKWTTRRIE